MSPAFDSFFADAYAGGLLVTLAEASSNLVVRGEQQLLSGELRRTAIRKHVFEGSARISRSRTRCITRGVVEAVARALKQSNASDLAHYYEAVRALAASMSSSDVLTLEQAEDRLFSHMLSQADVPLRDKLGKPTFDEVRGAFAQHVLGGIACRDLAQIDRLGKYVGYIDLRLSSPDSPIAFAVLSAPRHLRHGQDYRIVQSELGTLYGGPPVYGTVFAMVDPHFGGGCCSTAAILMAIANLADRGGRPVGHLDATVIASVASPVQRVGENCIRQNTQNAYRSVGLNYAEVGRILKHPAVNISSSVDCLADATLLIKIAKAYVDARCPLLLFVDCEILWRAIRGHSEVHREAGWEAGLENESTHMVVIVGYSTEKRELVIHDPSYAPYSRFSTEDLITASRGAAGGDDAEIYSIACIASRRIAFHLMPAITRLRDGAFDSIDYEFYWMLIAPSKYPSFMSELELVHRDDIFDWVSSSSRWLPSDIPVEMHLHREHLHKLEDDWYWMVVGSELTEDSSQAAIASPAIEYKRSCLWMISAQVEPTSRYWAAPVGGSQAVAWSIRVTYWADNAVVFFDSSNVDNLMLEEPLEFEGEPAGNVQKVCGRQLGEQVDAVLPIRDCFGPSLLTSSSELPLKDLLALHSAGSYLDSIELYALRRADIKELMSPTLMNSIAALRYGVAEWLSMPSAVSAVTHWVIQSLTQHNKAHSDHPVQISALATFFPGLSSFDISYKPHRADLGSNVAAITRQALINTMRIADQLWKVDAIGGQQIAEQEEAVKKRMVPNRIVEVVLGSLLDVCSCEQCENDAEGTVFFHSDWDAKVDHIISNLLHVIQQLKQPAADSVTWDNQTFCLDALLGEFAFAIEIEPGENSIINSPDSLDRFFEKLDHHPLADLLTSHVGLNLDIAHCILCDITCQRLERHLHRIVNAHIADHPGMHTRDHVPGTWREVESSTSIDGSYLRLLMRAATVKDRKLPFSFRIGLELEACTSPSWCDSGISTIRRMLARC